MTAITILNTVLVFMSLNKFEVNMLKVCCSNIPMLLNKKKNFFNFYEGLVSSLKDKMSTNKYLFYL